MKAEAGTSIAHDIKKGHTHRRQSQKRISVPPAPCHAQPQTHTRYISPTAHTQFSTCVKIDNTGRHSGPQHKTPNSHTPTQPAHQVFSAINIIQ
jgi:hypothetical protein